MCVSRTLWVFCIFICVRMRESLAWYFVLLCVCLCVYHLRSVYYIRYSTSFSHHIFLGRSIPLTPYKTIIAPLSPLPCMATIITTLPGGTHKTGREANASTLPPSLCPSTPTLCPSIISPWHEVSVMEGWMEGMSGQQWATGRLLVKDLSKCRTKSGKRKDKERRKERRETDALWLYNKMGMTREG